MLTHVIIKCDPLGRGKWDRIKIISKEKLQYFKQYLLVRFQHNCIDGISKCKTYVEVLDHFSFISIRLEDYAVMSQFMGKQIGEIPMYQDFKQVYKIQKSLQCQEVLK